MATRRWDQSNDIPSASSVAATDEVLIRRPGNAPAMQPMKALVENLPAGPQGEKGDTGRSIRDIALKVGDNTKAVITYSDNTTDEIDLPVGPRGQTGNTGNTGATGRGISSIALKSDDNTKAVVTFSDSSTSELDLPVGPRGLQGNMGNTGHEGWSPTFAVESDGARRVLKVIGWVGGGGSAPAVPASPYVGSSGLVAAAANAIDIRGAVGQTGNTGDTGATGDDAWSPVLSVESDGARRVLKITDWAGGEGTKPAVPSDPYIGSSGLVGSAASAIDIRGATGQTGNTGATGDDAWSPVLAVESSGQTRVLKITDWTGGEGTKPAVPTNPYIGSSGLVATAGEAINVRGSKGQKGDTGDTGATGDDAWSPIISVESDGARRVLKVTGWTGGEGSTPAVPSDPYIGASGLVAAAANAIDIRGAMGVQGHQGAYDVTIFRNAANASAAGTPTGGSIVVATRATTLPTGWALNPTTPPDGEETFASRVSVNPATQTGTITPSWSPPYLAGGTGPTGEPGSDGDAGWSPVIAVESDGARRVLKVIDWVGGEGTKPAVPSDPYLAATGLVANAASAIDVRGSAGATGGDGDDGDDGNDAWSPIISVESDGARRVLKITDWTGGEGSKPAVPSDPYIGASGLVANAAAAVDIRGAAGTAGSAGRDGTAGSAGSDGNDGWAPVVSVEADDARRVLKITDWTGGEGTKPALPTNPYLGSTGLVATAAAAQDIRGPSGGFSLTTIGDADLTSLGNSLTWFDTGIDMPDTVASGEIWALRAVDSGNPSSERDPEDIIFFAASDVSGASNSTSGSIASPSENAGFVFSRHLANADQTFILGKDSNGNILLWSRNSISRGMVLEIWRVGGTGSGGGLVLPTTVTQAEAEAGTETNVRSWTPKRVAEAIAALAGESLSDTDIGDKAFKNPPSDLNDDQKAAVREAIGSGADEEAGGFSLEEIAITDAIPGTDVTASTWFDTGLNMPADVPDDEVWAIQLYKNNATANKIEQRLIFVRAAIVRDATAQIAAQQVSQPHRSAGFGFHIFVDSDSVASDWILGRNSDNDILLWGSVGQANSTRLTLAIYRVVGSGSGGGAAITHPAPTSPANADDDKLYAASGNIGPLQYQVIEAAKTTKITSEPLESRGQHYIVHGWARVRAGQASRTGGHLDPIPEGWRALIEFNQTADADGWAVELVTDRAEPWLSLTSGLTLRITGSDGTLRTRVLNQSIASDHINFIATGQSRALLEEGETLVLAARDHGASVDRDLHAGAAFYRNVSTDVEIAAEVAARLRPVLSDVTATDADLNAVAALTRQILAELKPLGAVAGTSNWQDVSEAELQEHYGVAVQPQSDTDFAGAVFYSSRLEESGGARIIAVSVPHGIDPASVRLRQRRAGSDIDTMPNAAQEWEAFTPSDALRHVDYYRLIGSTSTTWAAVALQTGDSIVLQIAELSHVLSIPLSALAQGGANGGQALLYDADADEWRPGDVAAGGGGESGAEQSFRAPLNDVTNMATSYTRLALGTPDIDQGDFTVATNRVAVTHAGRYLVIGHITADSSSGNDGSQDRVRLYGRLARRAGGTTTASEEVVTDYARRQYAGFYSLSVEVSELFDLAAGEEIELQGYAQKQDTATTVALDGSGSSLALIRIGAVVSASGLRDALIGIPPNQPVIPQDAGSLSAHHAAWGGGFDPTIGGPFGVTGLLLEPVSPVPNTDVRYVSTGGRVQIGRHLNSRGQLVWRDTYGVADPARCILQASLTAAAGSSHLMVFCIGTNNPAQLSGDSVNRGWQLFDRGIAIALDPLDGNGNGGGTLNMLGRQDAGGGAAYNVNDGFWGNAVARATAGMWEVPSGVSGVVANPSTTDHRQNARLALNNSRRLDASTRTGISIETFDRELRLYWDRELIAIWHWAADFAPFRSARPRGNNYMVRSTAGDRVVVSGTLTAPTTYAHEFAVSPAQRRSPGYDRFL